MSLGSRGLAQATSSEKKFDILKFISENERIMGAFAHFVGERLMIVKAEAL